MAVIIFGGKGENSSPLSIPAGVIHKMQSSCGRFIQALVLSALIFSVGSTAWSYDKIGPSGDVGIAVLTAAAGGMTLAFKDREGMLQLAESAALDLAVVVGLKYSVSERRPNGVDNHSFPSAHSSVAFTSAEYLRKRYGWEYGLPAYGLAAFVAYSRVAADKHYLHDVLAGAAIGIAGSYIFTTSNPNFNVSAEAAPGYYGVRLTKAW